MVTTTVIILNTSVPMRMPTIWPAVSVLRRSWSTDKKYAAPNQSRPVSDGEQSRNISNSSSWPVSLCANERAARKQVAPHCAKGFGKPTRPVRMAMQTTSVMGNLPSLLLLRNPHILTLK